MLRSAGTRLAGGTRARPATLDIRRPNFNRQSGSLSTLVPVNGGAAWSYEKKDESTSLPKELQGTTGPAFGLALTGIVMSQEMYVVNDETMLAAGWLGLMYVFVKVCPRCPSPSSSPQARAYGLAQRWPVALR